MALLGGMTTQCLPQGCASHVTVQCEAKTSKQQSSHSHADAPECIVRSQGAAGPGGSAALVDELRDASVQATAPRVGPGERLEAVHNASGQDRAEAVQRQGGDTAWAPARPHACLGRPRASIAPRLTCPRHPALRHPALALADPRAMAIPSYAHPCTLTLSLSLPDPP